MIVAAILLGVCQIITPLGLCLFLRHIINAKQHEIEQKAEAVMREWLTAPENQPSKAALLIDKAGSIIGAAAARSIMSSINSEKSHVARVANGVADELQGAQNPILGLLAGGKRGKGAAVMQLAGMLQGILAPSGKVDSSSDNGAGSDVSNRIRNQS